jgi:hypothetical protein
MIPSSPSKPSWLKNRGYLHVTPKIDVYNCESEILGKVKNENFVARHGFFPLIHTIIKERKYKRHPENKKIRGHSHFIKGRNIKSTKLRPLHYSTHIDSMIFGYYADLLLKAYEIELENHVGLDNSIIAYRKIPIEGNKRIVGDQEVPSKGKSTIHFANEAFDEIKQRSKDGCAVLLFDIKSFFSELDHNKLKQVWTDLLDVPRLNRAHFNVFKAATDFSYILLDDLRINQNNQNRKSGFDEKKLSYLRKTKGVECFYESVEQFKEEIKNKTIKVYKHPFVKNKIPVGIPQGLPISAVLANLYLLPFDINIYDKVVVNLNGYYRRYSDDILIICKPDEVEDIKREVNEAIKERSLKISEEKTETFLFRELYNGPKTKRLTSIRVYKDWYSFGIPLTYLGFEFYGYKKLIKSTNLAKFYRRIIYSVKRKAKRAIKISNKVGTPPTIFRGRLMKLYSCEKLDAKKIYKKRKKLVKNHLGEYNFEFSQVTNIKKSNYFSYVRRASKIMNQPEINKQVRKHRIIFNKAISKHSNK